MAHTLERLLLGAALVVAGVSVYLALDARSAANDAMRNVVAVRSEAAAFKRGFHPTLVVQQRTDSPFDAPRVPPTGELTNVTLSCADGSVAVGGGFNGFDGVTIGGSLPTGGNGGPSARGDGWLINAYNENNGRGRVAPAVLCARGEGGLRVRSTGTAAHASKGLG